MSDDEENNKDEEVLKADNTDPEQVVVTRICIGRKCHLMQTPKQFTSKGTNTKAGPKKCSVCTAFEPALNKCLEVEKYLATQLVQPEEDVDMFKMLQGLSGLMVDSKGRQVRN